MSPDDIPTEITKLVYTAPKVGGFGPSAIQLSQNEVAVQLAHYWPAIEAHIRAAAFREAARVVEQLGHSDDAVNVLDNIASGLAAVPAAGEPK